MINKKEEANKMEKVSFDEIIDMMSNAEDYSELYEAASYIEDFGLRLDVENLIGQCEDDGDGVETAYSVVTSDLLDDKKNEENVFVESAKLEEDAGTLDNAEEEDLATMLYSDIMENASFERDGTITPDYEFLTLEDIQDWYDGTVTEETYNKVVPIVDKVLKTTKYYNDSESAGVDISIELSDNHTLWDIDAPEGTSEETVSTFYENEYGRLVQNAAEEFEAKTGEPLMFLGRSGRHVCVANHFLNAYRSEEFKGIQKELEAGVIADAEAFLKGEQVEESKKVTEGVDLPEEDIVWEDIENYSEDEINEIRDILKNLEVKGVKINGHSVAVKDEYSGLIFWLDFANVEGDLEADWNQYIFSETNNIDRMRNAIQSSYSNKYGDTIAFDAMEGAAVEYLAENGYIDNDYQFVDECLSRKVESNKYIFEGDFGRAVSKVGEGRKLLNDILENHTDLDKDTDSIIRDAISTIVKAEMELMKVSDKKVKKEGVELSPEDEEYFNDEIEKTAREEVEKAIGGVPEPSQEEIEKELDGIEESKKLQESVPNEAYVVAEAIAKEFEGKETVSWDEFSTALEKCMKNLDMPENYFDEDLHEFENDVRGILGTYGFATEFEGDNEGGLTTKLESQEQVDNKEVPDEAYEIAELIADKFAGKEIISRDDFDIAFEDAKAVTVSEDFEDEDLENEVRGILSYKGWGTDFESGDLTTVTESKKLEEKDTKKEFEDYCNDLGLDKDKMSSMNKFIKDYADNYVTLHGTANFEEEMARVRKELKENLRK